MSIWTTLRAPYFPHTYKQTKTGRFVRSLCAVSRSLATLFSFFINLTCFIWFRNDSTEKSFGKTFSWKTFDSSYHCTQKKHFFCDLLTRRMDEENSDVLLSFYRFLSSLDRLEIYAHILFFVKKIKFQTFEHMMRQISMQ